MANEADCVCEGIVYEFYGNQQIVILVSDYVIGVVYLSFVECNCAEFYFCEWSSDQTINFGVKGDRIWDCDCFICACGVGLEIIVFWLIEDEFSLCRSEHNHNVIKSDSSSNPEFNYELEVVSTNLILTGCFN